MPTASHPVWHLPQHGQRPAVRTRSRRATDDINAVMHAALQGAGVAYGAYGIAANEWHDKRLVAVLPPWEMAGSETLHVIWPSGECTPAPTRVHRLNDR